MSFNGGYESDFGSVTAATELIAGIAKLATQGQVNNGSSGDTIVTPATLVYLLNQVVKYESGQNNTAIIPKQGNNNLADGDFCLIPHGNHNHASGSYSSAAGLLAESVTYNEAVKAGGGFYNVQGSAQVSTLNLFNLIPPSSGSVWGVAVDGNGFGSLNKWIIHSNSVIQFRAQFTVTQNSGSEGAIGNSWTGLYEGAIKNVNGVVTWLGGLPVLREVRQDLDFSPSTGFMISGIEVLGFVGGLTNRSLHANIAITFTQTKFGLAGGGPV
jgi:hypothetical protein